MLCIVLSPHAHGRLLAEKLGKAAEHGAPTSSTRHQEDSGLHNDSARYASAVMAGARAPSPPKPFAAVSITAGSVCRG